MDYKYIEQLLNRYWMAETTQEEEKILRTFYRQENLPEGLKKYKDLFTYEAEAAETGLSQDFEDKLMERIEAQPKVVKAVRRARVISFKPFYQAAASIAVVMLVGLAAQRSFQHYGTEGWDYNPENYKDTYSSEQQAYKVVETGLEMFQRTAKADTTKKVEIAPKLSEE